MNYVTLNNGIQMPMVGFGVFEIDEMDQLKMLDENHSMWAEYDDPIIVQYAMAEE